MGNNLGPFTEASDWHEGQEHAAQAVGGRGALHGVFDGPISYSGQLAR